MKKSSILRFSTGLILTSVLLSAPLLDAADGPSAKATKYHEILRKRPSSGYVFDRFYDSWLDTGTSAELEKYLSKAAESGKANDQLLLAYYYLRQGKELDALKLYQTSIKTDPTNSKIRLQKAKLEAQLLNFDGALKDLDAAMEKADDDGKMDIQHLRGRYLARSGRFEEAQKTWKALLTARPNDDDLIDSILEVQLAEGLFDEALLTSDMQIKNAKDPYQKVVFTLRRGDIYQRSGKRKKAIDTYVSTLDAVGENSWLEREILAQLREIYRRDDDMEGLKKLYTELSKTNPQRVGLRKAHAHLLVSLGKNDKAEALFREILKITPGNRKNREELVSILLKAGKADLALKEVEALAKASPKDATLQLKLVAVLHAAEKDAAIPAALTTYLAIKGHKENAYLVAAGLLKKYKQPELAVKELRKALKTHADSEECTDALAHLLIELKQEDEAITLWKKMIATGTRESVIRHTRSLKAAGEDQLAYELLTQRAGDFKADLVFLTHLTNEALSRKDYDKATASAQSILKLSQHTEEIRQAVKLSATVAFKAKKEAELTQSLAKNEKRSTVESWLLAELYEIQGQSKEAVAVLEGLRAEDANMAAIAEVALYEYRGDWSNAAMAMERMLALPKGKKPLHLRRLVDLYYRLDETKKALKHIETWKQLAPGDKNPWFKQADILSGNGDRTAAIQILRRAAQRFEADDEFRAQLAALYQENDQFGDAERLYWRLYEEAKNLKDRMRWVPQLSEIYEAQGKSNELIARFKEKRKSNPKSVEPLLALAEIYRFNENYEGRRKSMLEAARLRPNDPEILFAIAQLEEREGDIDRAADTLTKAVDLDKSEQSKRYLAQFYMRNGEVDKGIEIIKALASGPNVDPRALEKAAASIANGGDIEAALKFLDEALLNQPDDYRLAYLKAIFLVQDEQFELAFNQLVAALDMNKDLPGAKPVMTQAQWTQMFQRSGGFFPKSKMSMIYDSYAGRLIMNKTRGNPYSGRSRRGRQPATYQLPGDLKEKNPLIEGSLLALMNQMDDEVKKQHISQLTILGVKDAEYRMLLVGVMSGGQQDYEPLKEYARNHPKQAEVFTFPVMIEVMQMIYSGFNGNKKMDTEFLELAQKNAKNLTPFVAFSIEMALMNFEDKKKASESWKKARAYAEKMKDESVAMAGSILSVSLSKNKDLNPEVRADAMKLAQQWYWASFEPKSPNVYSFMGSNASVLGGVILHELAEKKDKKEFVLFLRKTCDAYVESQKKSKGSSQVSMANMMRMYGGRSAKSKFDLPPFPPKNYEEVPVFIAQLFKKDQSNQRSYGLNNNEPIDIEALALDQVLDQVQNPYLKIQMAHYYEKDTELAAAIKEIVDVEQPTLEAIYFQVGYLVYREKMTEAATVLAKARFLPMRRNQRKQLDEYLTALALNILTLEGKEKDELRPLAIDAGKRAALRLRKSSATPQERKRLISALDDLGLQKEADLVASSVSSRPSPSGSRGSNAPSQIEQIDAALKKGEKEKAQRLALREMKSLIRQPRDYNTTSNQKKLHKLLESNDMLDWVQERMDPGESTSIRRKADYAMALHILGKKEESLKIFEALGKKGSKDEKVLLMLVFNLPEDRLEESAAYLVTLLTKYPNAHREIDRYYEELDDESVERWLHGYMILTSAMKQFPESKKTKVDLSWVRNVADDLVTSEYVKGTSYPHIGDPSYPEKIKKDKTGMMKKRLSVARDFLEVAITKPSLASWAFPYYESSFVSMKEEKDLDVTMAFTALKNVALSYENQKKTPNNYQMMNMLHSMNSSSQKFEGKSPLNYLSHQAWLTKNHDLLSDEYLHELTEIDEDFGASVKLMQSIIFLSDEELESEIAKSFAKKTKKDREEKSLLITDSLIDLCLLRKHSSAALEQWMTSEVSLKDGMAWQKHALKVQRMIPRYIILLIDQEPSRITPLLEKVITAIIQPEGEMEEFIKKNKDDKNYGITDPKQRIQLGSQLLNNLYQSDDPTMAIHVGRYLVKNNIESLVKRESLLQKVRYFRPQTLDEALRVFDRAGFGKMQTTEELVSADDQVGQSSFFAYFVESLGDRMTGADSSNSNILLKDVEKSLPSLNDRQQFFVKLAVISQFKFRPENKQDFLDLLTNHAETIEKWDEGMTSWFSEEILKQALYDKPSNSIVIPKDYPKSVKASLKKYQKSSQAALSRKLDAVLAMKEIEDSNSSEFLVKSLIENTSGFLSEDRAKYIQAIVHVSSMMRKLQETEFKKNSYNHPFLRSSHYSRDLTGKFYEKLLAKLPMKKIPEKVSFFYEVFQADESSFKSLPINFLDQFSYSLTNYYGILRFEDRSKAVYAKELRKVIKDFESLPKEQEKLAALMVLNSLLEGVKIPQENQRTCLKIVEKLAEKNPSLIKTAICAAYGANITERMPSAWGLTAANHVRKLYQGMPDSTERVLLSHILAEEGGEMFCDGQIEIWATQAIADSLEKMDTVQRHRAYQTLHAITFQKSSKTHQDLYLDLYNQLKNQIKEAEKSVSNTYSSSSSSSYSSGRMFNHISQSMLGLALRSGDDAAVHRTMLRHKSHLVGNPYAVSLALRYGNVDLAVKLWRNVKMRSNSDGSGDIVLDPDKAPMGLFDRTLETSLDEFVQRAPKDVNRQMIRNQYMLRSSTFDPATKPKDDYKARCILIVKSLKDASYNGVEASILVRAMLRDDRNEVSKSLDGALCKELAPLTPAWMKDLREEEKDNFVRRWKKSYFYVMSLYFKKLVEDDNLDEFLQVTSEINAAAKKGKKATVTGPFFAVDLLLQKKIFEAIEAGDMKKIQHYRKFVEPIATNAILHSSYHFRKEWSLSVPLLGICYAYSDSPQDYAEYVKTQYKARKNLNEYHYLTEYYTYTPLMYANYQGKPFAHKVNREIRMKIFKQIITASNAGMFNFASTYKTNDGTSLSGYIRKYGKFLPDEDYQELIEFAITINPLHGSSLCNLGIHYQKKVKDYKKAEEYFHRAVALADESKDKTDLGKYMFLEAESMALGGKYTEALKLAKSIPEDRINKAFNSYLQRDLPKWEKAAKK